MKIYGWQFTFSTAIQFEHRKGEWDTAGAVIINHLKKRSGGLLNEQHYNKLERVKDKKMSTFQN